MPGFMTPPTDAMKTQWGPIWLSEEGIIINISAQASQNKEDVAEYLAYIKKAGGGIRRPYLIEISRVRAMSKDVRDEYKRLRIQELVTAIALVTQSAIAKMIGNILIGISTSTIPTRLFNDQQKAREWLMQFRIN